jgi:serine protease Do
MSFAAVARADGQRRDRDLPEVSAPKVAVLQELELVSLTPTIRAERGIRAARGAVVYNVSDASRTTSASSAATSSYRSTAADRVRGTTFRRPSRATPADRPSASVYERGGRIYYTDVVIQ